MPEINFPKKEFLNFSSITEGEALLALKKRNQLIRSAIEYSKGNTGLAKKHREVAQHFDKVLNGGLHTSNAGELAYFNFSAEQPLVNKLIIHAANSERVAMNITSGFQLANNPLPFDPTPEQRQKCKDQAGFKALAASNGLIDPFTFNGLVTKFENECLKPIPLQNIVHAHLEESGAQLFYAALADGSVNWNNRIFEKRREQKAWITETAKITGLSRDIVQTIVENGAMIGLNETPESIVIKLKPLMEDLSQQNSTALSNVSRLYEPTTIILIASIISAVLGAAKSIAAFIKELKARKAIYNAVKDPSTFQPLETDFNNNGISDEKETPLQSIITPANGTILVGLGLLYLGNSQNGSQIRN